MAEQRPWTTKTTTDHDTVREWVEARDAVPARATPGDEDDRDVLRIDSPERDSESDANLEAVSWDEFFERFESAGLAFRYRDEEPTGERSHFHRFVRREETGVADAPEADVSVVAVAATATPSDRQTDPEDPDRPEMESASEMNVESPSEGADAEAERRPALTAGLVVDEIHEDAGGYDHWNKNDEYLVLRNDGEEPLDLAGWTVENDDGKTYEFREEFGLDPGRTVTLHSGSGEDTDTDRYWGSERAVWKNTGDVLTVRDADGRQVIRVSY
ncbi:MULTISPECIES: lamin tail domain-containing protein [Halorussus]|uniref:lamin tail domain-containing protein n=1 Tax=Halorussus TaxID=1070314 RepID=UPI0020A0803C|nr:lamin tail domain-containing protein [Halorussus vallis]USZ75458.1 lamin tail domain-containing protein [Halorussus vallis]